MGLFDDLIPRRSTGGLFDDLIPQKRTQDTFTSPTFPEEEPAPRFQTRGLGVPEPVEAPIAQPSTGSVARRDSRLSGNRDITPAPEPIEQPNYENRSALGVTADAVKRGALRTASSLPMGLATSDATALQDAARSDTEILWDTFKQFAGAEAGRFRSLDLSSPEKASQALSDAGMPPQSVNTFRQILDQRQRRANDARENRDVYLQRYLTNAEAGGSLLEKAYSIPMSPAAERMKEQLAKDESFSGTLSALVANPLDALAFLGEVGVESAPAIAASMATAAATRNPVLSGAMLGVGSAGQEFGASAYDVFQDAGLKIDGPESAKAALDNPALWAAAGKRGATRATVIALFEMMGQGVAAKQLMQSEVGNALVQTLAQMGTGAGGEAAAQFASGEKLKAGEILIEGLAEGLTAPFEVGSAVIADRRASGGTDPNDRERTDKPRDYSNSPLLTENDRNSPVPDDVIGQGKEIIKDIQEGRVPDGAVPMDTLYGKPIAPLDEAAPNVRTPTPEAVQRPLPTDRLSPTMGAAPRPDTLPQRQEAPIAPQAPVAATERAFEDVPEVEGDTPTGRTVRVYEDGQVEFIVQEQNAQAQEPVPQTQEPLAVSDVPTPAQRTEPRETLQKRPLTNLLKGIGVKPGSPLAVELESRGINQRTAPGLFKATGHTDWDNLPVSEWQEYAPIIGDDGNGYLSRDGLIEAVEREARGEPVQVGRQAELQEAKDLREYAREFGRDDDVTIDLSDMPEARAYIPSRDEDISTETERAQWVRRDIDAALSVTNMRDIITPAEYAELFDGLEANGGNAEDMLWGIIRRSADGAERPDFEPRRRSQATAPAVRAGLGEQGVNRSTEGGSQARNADVAGLDGRAARAEGQVDVAPVSIGRTTAQGVSTGRSSPSNEGRNPAGPTAKQEVADAGNQPVIAPQVANTQRSADADLPALPAVETVDGATFVTGVPKAERARLGDAAAKAVWNEKRQAWRIPEAQANAARAAIATDPASSEVSPAPDLSEKMIKGLTRAAGDIGWPDSSLSTELLQAEKNGWIEFWKNPQNSMTRYFRLTDEGKRVLGNAPKQSAKTTSEPAKTLPKLNEGFVIRNKDTGEAVLETRDQAKLDALNTDKYEAVPVRQHLAELSDTNSKARKAAEQAPAAKKESPAVTKVNDIVAPDNAEGTGFYTNSDGDVQIDDLGNGDAEITITTSKTRYRGRAKETKENSQRLKYSEVKESLSPAAREAVEKIIGEQAPQKAAEGGGTSNAPIDNEGNTSGSPALDDSLFDVAKFDADRNARIKESRAAGYKHLDKVTPAVETMRGLKIEYVHNPSVKGVVRTVANTGDVLIYWSDKASAEAELAIEKTEGRKKVWQSWLSPRDLKDYRVQGSGKPTTERTEAGTQTVVPGAEQSTERSEKARDADRKREVEVRARQSKMRTGVPQDGPGGLFDTQGDMFKEQRQPSAQDAATVEAALPDLRKRLNQMMLKRVSLEAVEGATFQGAFEARGDDLRILVGQTQDGMKTVNHEAVHALRNLNLFTDAEWDALSDQAVAEWLDKYDIANRYDDLNAEAQIEEAIAEAFADFVAEQTEPGPIKAAFAKMRRMFRALKEWLTDNPSVQGVFEAVDTGRVGRRQGQGRGDSRSMQKAINTTTAAFKRWFGDSKVVDDNGDPLVVYHGTRGDFDSFDADKYGVNDSGWYGRGIYLTAHGSSASSYSGWDEMAGSAPNGAKVIPAYVSLKNPYIWPSDRRIVDRAADSRDLTRELIQQGYDGVIVRNQYDDGIKGKFFEVVAFRPEQIKSVYNRGTFDPDDARIMYQRQPTARQKAQETLDQMPRDVAVPNRAVFDELFTRNRGAFKNIGQAKGAIGDRMDVAREYMQDRILPLRRAQEAIERETGHPISEAMNAYVKEETYHGKVGRRLDDIQQFTIVPIRDLIAESADLDTAKVNDYLTALHAEERNARIAKINPTMPDGGSGMTNAEAQKILKDAKMSKDYPALKEIARLIGDLRDRTLQLRVDAGLMTAKDAAVLKSMYQNYVPLKGFEEFDGSEALSDRPNIGRGYSVKGPETKRALGRKSRSFDVLANMLTQAQEVAIRAEKNRVGKAVFDLASQYPSDNLWKVREVETKRVFNKQTGLVETRSQVPTARALADNEMAVKIDGKEYRIEFLDPRLARAMGAVKSGQMGPLMQWLSLPARYFSAVNTMIDPEFVIRNAFRDMQAAQINIRNFGEGDRNAIAKGMIKNWPKAFKAAYQGQKGKSDTEWTKWYREFEEAGAKVSFWKMEDAENMKADLDRQIALRRGNKLVRAGKVMVSPSALFSIRDNAVLGFIERTNLAVDNAVRLAAYVEARKAGWSKQKAASLSKNLTVNFNRRGHYGPVMNALYPFYNAGMQGTQVLFRAMSNPKRMSKYIVGMIGLGVMNDLINAAISDEDDDGVLAYDKLQKHKQEMSLVFSTGDDVVTIPLSYGYNVFPYMGTLIGQVMRGVKDPDEAIVDFADAAVSAFSPVYESDGMRTILPMVMDLPYDLATNSDWLHRPIRPENPYGDYGPDAYKFYGGASEWAKGLADVANRATGGTIAEPGMIDISPEYIDHIWGFASGGAGRFVSNTGDMAAKILSGKTDEIEGYRVPFARQAFSETGHFLDRDRYYRFRDEVNEAVDAREVAQEAGEPLSKLSFDLSKLKNEVKLADKVLRAVRNERAAVGPDATPEQRKEWEARESKAILRFNEKYVDIAGASIE